MRRFALRLALKVGRVDVDQMLAEISTEQFMEWVEFNSLEPFGDEWRQTGKIVAKIHNAHFGRKGERHKPEEFFMPIAQRETEVEQTPEQQIAIARSIAALHNAGKKQ